jgi:hypothetical protein
MDFSNKCEVLGDLWLFYREDIKGNEAWEEFFAYNDIALPLAYMIKEDYATINEDSDATSYIEETWETFCDYVDIDPNGEYKDIREAFDASPNKPLETE